MMKMGPCRNLAVGWIIVLAFSCPAWPQREDFYSKPDKVETRWSSFENLNGRKGAGGRENQGAKGHPSDSLEPGESKVLLDVKGSGLITRMWFTVIDRSPEMLRSLRLEIYWDGAEEPAVFVPFGDFFGAILGRPVAFESALFSNPEGRSFNCTIPMPFRKSAKVILTNETAKRLSHLYFDVDYLLGVRHRRNMLYFHAHWRRENPTELAQDFEILPRVKGAGRFLGTNIDVIVNPENIGWWGEGEVKMYLDGDRDYPTLAGTGVEDYIGNGWGQGTYDHQFQGCLVSDKERGQYTFYRYHVPDPVYFDEDIRVTIQQMGGRSVQAALDMLDQGVPVIPVTTFDPKTGVFTRLLDADPPVDLAKDKTPKETWCNYYRRDDVCAVAYFYLDRPTSGLPPLAPVEERTAEIARP